MAPRENTPATQLRLSRPMKRMLSNLLAGDPINQGCRKWPGVGGTVKVLRALRSRHLITDHGDLTELGRSVAEQLPGQKVLFAAPASRDLAGQKRMFE
ncbi:MAG: hypothetical protein JWN86_709 [Planctomycetota bacterium]|jgi:hypothetical protein|nr:hypothetical protein [Planctomycetota bacterium]